MRTTFAVSVAVLLGWAGTAHAVDYTWDGGGDATTWSDAGNWDPGSGPPAAATDRAVIPSGTPWSITTGVAVTIGQLDMESGCTATVMIGADFAISNAADSGVLSLSGTFDAHNGGDHHMLINGHFTNRADGTFEASANTTTIRGHFKSTGTFVHNNGRVVFDCVSTAKRVRMYPGGTVFYDVTFEADTGFDGRPESFEDYTIENNLQMDTHYLHLGDNVTLTMGTLANSGSITGTENVTLNGTATRLQGVHPDWPVLVQNGYAKLAFNGNNGQPIYIKWVDFQENNQYGSKKRVAITLEGDCSFVNFWPGHWQGSKYCTLDVGDHTATFSGNLTLGYKSRLEAASGTITVGGDLVVDAPNTNDPDSATIVVSGMYANGGTFHAGSSTVILTNGSSTVYNNNQAFYNLTTVPGAGNTVTLPALQVSAISNLLSVVNGTCTTPDLISEDATGAGTWTLLTGGINTIFCGVSPQVAAGAVLETGNSPTAGTVITIR